MTDLRPCDTCGAPAIADINGKTACAEHLHDTMAAMPSRNIEDVDLPVLPYGVGGSPYGGPDTGWSGSDTSRERAERERDDGTVSHRQRQTLASLNTAGVRGLTWRELGAEQGWHHGQSSSTLSVLHKDGRIARLVERRDRCHVYVLLGYVGERDTQPHGRQAPERDGSLEMALDDLDVYERKLAAIRALCEEYALLDPGQVIEILDGQ